MNICSCNDWLVASKWGRLKWKPLKLKWEKKGQQRRHAAAFLRCSIWFVIGIVVIVIGSDLSMRVICPFALNKKSNTWKQGILLLWFLFTVKDYPSKKMSFQPSCHLRRSGLPRYPRHECLLGLRFINTSADALPGFIPENIFYRLTTKAKN